MNLPTKQKEIDRHREQAGGSNLDLFFQSKIEHPILNKVVKVNTLGL